MGCIVHGVAKSQTQLSDFHFQYTLTIVIKIIFIITVMSSSFPYIV